jgi:hypothetical protein
LSWSTKNLIKYFFNQSNLEIQRHDYFLIDYLVLFYSRFASGSKDGTARIWTFRQGEWHSSQLIMRAEDGRRVYFNTSKQAEEPLR